MSVRHIYVHDAKDVPVYVKLGSKWESAGNVVKMATPTLVKALLGGYYSILPNEIKSIIKKDDGWYVELK